MKKTKKTKKKRTKIDRPKCYRCKGRMNAKWQRKKLLPDVLIGWGHNAGNLFCSQRCGYLFALDVIHGGSPIKVVGGLLIDGGIRKKALDKAVRAHNSQAPGPGAWTSEEIEEERFPRSGKGGAE